MCSLHVFNKRYLTVRVVKRMYVSHHLTNVCCQDPQARHPVRLNAGCRKGAWRASRLPERDPDGKGSVLQHFRI